MTEHKTTESLLKPFTKNDWDGYAGACRFADGGEPLIAHMPGFDVIVAGDCDTPTVWVTVNQYNDVALKYSMRDFRDSFYGTTLYRAKAQAIKYAEFLLANPELIENLEVMTEA